MRRLRTVAGMSAIVACVSSLTASAARGDTGGVGVGGSETVPGGPSVGDMVPILLLAAGVAAIALVLILVARYVPRLLRPLQAALVLAGSAIGAFLVVALGVLSSWTDEGSNVPLPFVIGAVLVLALGVLVALRVAGVRIHRAAPGAPSVPPPDADAGR